MFFADSADDIAPIDAVAARMAPAAPAGTDELVPQNTLWPSGAGTDETAIFQSQDDITRETLSVLYPSSPTPDQIPWYRTTPAMITFLGLGVLVAGGTIYWILDRDEFNRGYLPPSRRRRGRY